MKKINIFNSSATRKDTLCFFSWIIFLLFARFVIDRLTLLYSIIIGKTYVDYNSFDISDWLINYEGGFIRRGILGQILWEVEQLHLYDVRIAIAIICLVTSIILLIIIIRIFKEEGWSMLIIPTGFLFGFTVFNLGGRRDMISLLLTFVIFMLYNMKISHQRKNSFWCFLFYLVSIIQILVHEASFFYTFPILILYDFKIIRNKQSFCIKSLLCLLHFMPMIITMVIVCIFKGSSNVAEFIWISWKEVFNNFPCYCDTTMIGKGVDALAWGAKETFLNHLRAGYLGFHSPSYLRIPIVFFNFFAAYLLITRINAIDMKIWEKRQMNNVLMSNILLIQLLAMIPMFTILSCDWGRTIPYWLFSSLFFYHVFKYKQIEFFPFLTIVSRKFQTIISNNPILRNNYTYILLVLLCPIPGACAPFDFANTFQQGFIEHFCMFLRTSCSL